MLRPKMTTAYGVFSRRMRRSRSVSEVLVMPMPRRSVDIDRDRSRGMKNVHAETRGRGEKQLPNRDVDAIAFAARVGRYDRVLSRAQWPFACGRLAVDDPGGVVRGAEME